MMGLLAAIATSAQPPDTRSAHIVDPESTPVGVLFSAKRSYRTAAAAIETTLEAKGYRCVLVELPMGGDGSAQAGVLEQLNELNPAVIAAGGTTATALAIEAVPDVPVIFFMVPNALDAPFLSQDYRGRSRVAGVTSDVSPADSLDWINRVHPSLTSLAVLYSPRSRHSVERIRAAAPARRIKCSLIPADRAEFPKAIDALNRSGCDGVLMIPDASVYTSPSVQRLLLWGARRKKSVWAFSENLVRAGALAGLHADAGAVGRQTAEIILDVISGSDVSTIGVQYPRYVERAVNEYTARMIGLWLDHRRIGAATVRFGEQ